MIIKRQLYTYENKINDRSIEIDELKDYYKIKDKYDQNVDHRTKGSWIQLRIDNMELSEKKHSNLPNSNHKSAFAIKNINQIVHNQNIEINDAKHILIELKIYYVNLYNVNVFN